MYFFILARLLVPKTPALSDISWYSVWWMEPDDPKQGTCSSHLQDVQDDLFCILVVHLQQWWPLDRPTRGKNLRYCNCNFYQNWRGKSWKICSKHFKVVKIFKNHGESWWINQWSSRFFSEPWWIDQSTPWFSGPSARWVQGTGPTGGAGGLSVGMASGHRKIAMENHHSFNR